MPVSLSEGDIPENKGTVKLHTLFYLRDNIPTIVFITNGKVREVNIIDKLPVEAGAIYIMDRGYLDYTGLYKLHQSAAYFVTRAKNNARYHRRYYQKIDKTSGLKSDQVITLHGYYSKKDGSSGFVVQENKDNISRSRR
ncbi:MAG TPA: transposase [Smithellaceae bacterium]|nr:transposase [Smithellaceae bacterium]